MILLKRDDGPLFMRWLCKIQRRQNQYPSHSHVAADNLDTLCIYRMFRAYIYSFCQQWDLINYSLYSITAWLVSHRQTLCHTCCERLPAVGTNAAMGLNNMCQSTSGLYHPLMSLERALEFGCCFIAQSQMQLFSDHCSWYTAGTPEKEIKIILPFLFSLFHL